MDPVCGEENITTLTVYYEGLNSMHHPIHSAIYFLVIAMPQLCWAFDDDDTLNEPNFKPENFLDIKAYEFRKSVEEEWNATRNGWRIAGGSLSPDIAFIDSEVRLQNDLSESFSIRLQHEYEAYIDTKPMQHPLLEMAYRPWRNDLELSLLATAFYDKRQSDIGFAASYGNRQEDYLRLSWLSVDHYYNEKNYLDDSYYSNRPDTLALEAAFRLNQWQTRLFVAQDGALRRVTPSESEIFRHEGDRLEWVLDYYYLANALVGFTYRRWQTDKALQDAVENREQAIAHQLLDVYWLRPFEWLDELILGVRLDQFENQLRDMNNANQSYGYNFDTLQAYAMAQYDYSEHASWGLGLYLGKIREHKDYLLDQTDNQAASDIQGKLRMSWEYHSLDKHDRFAVHFSLNLDELENDLGDGGGLSYQGRF